MKIIEVSSCPLPQTIERLAMASSIIFIITRIFFGLFYFILLVVLIKLRYAWFVILICSMSLIVSIMIYFEFFGINYSLEDNEFKCFYLKDGKECHIVLGSFGASLLLGLRNLMYRTSQF